MNTTLKAVGIYFIIYSVVCFYYLELSNFQIDPYTENTESIIEHWSSNSIVKSKFVPVLGKGVEISSSDQTSYYISHPPFSYYFLHLFGIISHLRDIFYCNLFLVLLSGIFVYLTIALLTMQHAKSEHSIFGMIGMVIYTTHPTILKYQLFNFHPDIFVQTLLIVSNYILVKVMMKERYKSPKYLFLFSLVVFLMNYSSWFGVIYSAIILLIGIFNLRRAYKFIPYIILTALIVSLTLMLTYTQYAFIGGWKNVIYYFKDTYIKESALTGEIRPTSWHIFWNIIKNIGHLILVIGALILAAILKRRRKFTFTKNGYRYLIISIFPILVYSIIFIKYFQNSYTSIYFIPALVVIISIWLEKMYKNYNLNRELLKLASLIIITNLLLFAFWQK